MTVFFIFAAILLTGTLAVLLRPLLKQAAPADSVDASAICVDVLREQLSDLQRDLDAGVIDQAHYDLERGEIERRAIEDGQAQPAARQGAGRRARLAGALGVAVVALAIGMYVALGTPQAMQAGGGQQASHSVTPQQIQAMVARLAERLQENPDDGEGWLMLARSYNAMGRFPEASAAFGRAVAILPPDAQLLADYADTLAMAQGRSLIGDPEKIIKRALTVDPKNIKAMALLGSVAYEKRDYKGAIAAWQNILTVVPGDSNVAERIRTSIADAEAKLGVAPGSSVPAAVAAKPGTSTIQGTVSLDAALRAKAGDGDQVFVFARATSGPRMPLAIQRMTVKDLPARFALDDSKGMPGGPKLSDYKQVVIGARISKSGDAMPRPGDLEGLSNTVELGSNSVQVSISKVVQ
ncbi:MAG TPA: c-type cytochrome biogenesis protein CcmI [Rhodocyclaceae bacterium]